jgi:Cu(I)/Ag(I) efflux system membrane fusion protein
MRLLLKLFKTLMVPLFLGAVVAALAFWPEPASESTGGAADYTCSMHPQIRLPKGQKCPLCGMDLVPVAQLATLQAQLEERAGVQTEAFK